MRREPGEERPRPGSAKAREREAPRREERLQPEPREEERPPRNVQHGAERLLEESLEALGERVEERAPGTGVRAQRLAGLARRAHEERGGAVVERVRAGGRRVHPAKAVGLEPERAEARRRPRERVDRGAAVVQEAGARERERARAAADPVRPLADEHPPPLARERGRRGEAVRTRADHDGVRRAHGPGSSAGPGCLHSRGRPGTEIAPTRAPPWLPDPDPRLRGLSFAGIGRSGAAGRKSASPIPAASGTRSSRPRPGAQRSRCVATGRSPGRGEPSRRPGAVKVLNRESSGVPVRREAPDAVTSPFRWSPGAGRQRRPAPSGRRCGRSSARPPEARRTTGGRGSTG